MELVQRIPPESTHPRKIYRPAAHSWSGGGFQSTPIKVTLFFLTFYQNSGLVSPLSLPVGGGGETSRSCRPLYTGDGSRPRRKTRHPTKRRSGDVPTLHTHQSPRKRVPSPVKRRKALIAGIRSVKETSSTETKLVHRRSPRHRRAPSGRSTCKTQTQGMSGSPSATSGRLERIFPSTPPSAGTGGKTSASQDRPEGTSTGKIVGYQGCPTLRPSRPQVLGPVT